MPSSKRHRSAIRGAGTSKNQTPAAGLNASAWDALTQTDGVIKRQ